MNNITRKPFQCYQAPLFLFIIGLLLCPMPAFAELNDSQKEIIIHDFDTFAHDVFHESEIPGMAIAITDRNKIMYSKGFGVISLKNPRPVTPDTIFLINSMSKAFTSTVTGSLVEEGNISWNESVISVLPDFALNDTWATHEITINDLLEHNSGLWSYDGDLLIAMGLKPEEIVHQMRYLEMEHPFRSGYGYNNLHYMVVSEIINKTTGLSLNDNLQTRIFTPLEMNNTSTGFDIIVSPNMSKNGYAVHHVITSDGYLPVPMEKEYLWGEYGEIGAGGINSNVIDMSKWLRFWLNRGKADGKQLLNNTTIKEIINPANLIASGPGFNFSYAKGWVVKNDPLLPHPVIWHNGGTAGMSSYNGFIQEEGIGVIVLTNAGENGVPDFIGDTFMFMISNPSNYDDFINISTIKKDIKPSYQPSSYPRPSIETSVDPGNFTGLFQNLYYGTMNISLNSSAIIAELGQRPLKLNLKPVNSTVYLFNFVPQISGIIKPDGIFSGVPGSDGRVDVIRVDGFTMPDHTPVLFSRIS